MSAFSIRETIEREAQKSENPGQAIALFDLMSDISEECFSAGWIVSNGENLWKIKQRFEGLVQADAIDYGAGEIDDQTLIDLCELASESGCWWTLLNGDPVCVPLFKWLKLMTSQHCSTCAYFLKSDRGSVCNAFHTPQSGAIECADWTRATIDDSAPIKGFRVRHWTDYVLLEHQHAIRSAIFQQSEQLPTLLMGGIFCPIWLRQASQYIKIPFPEYWDTDRLVEMAERNLSVKTFVRMFPPIIIEAQPDSLRSR